MCHVKEVKCGLVSIWKCFCVCCRGHFSPHLASTCPAVSLISFMEVPSSSLWPCLPCLLKAELFLVNLNLY